MEAIFLNHQASFSLIVAAVLPGIGLLAIGFAWLYWAKVLRSLAATLFSLGASLLALMLLVIGVYNTPLVDVLEEVIWVILGATLLVYVGSLAGCVRFAQVFARHMIIFGVPGLIPLWILGGFVLMNTVCSFGTGGC